MSVSVGLLVEGYFNKIAEFYQHSTTWLLVHQQQLDSLSWFPGWLSAVFTQPNIQIQIAVNAISFSSTAQEKLLCSNFGFTL